MYSLNYPLSYFAIEKEKKSQPDDAMDETCGTKPNNPCLIPGLHIVEGENGNSTSCPLTFTCTLWHAHAHLLISK